MTPECKNLTKRTVTAIIFLAVVLVPIILGKLFFTGLMAAIFIRGGFEIIFIDEKIKSRLFLKISVLLLLTFYCYSFIAIRNLPQGLEMFLFAMTTVSISDITGYFIGKGYFGGKFLSDKKILPNLSPGKTWRGTIGSIIIPILLSIPLAYYYNQSIIISLAAILTTVAFGGDILASWYKRHFGKKDFCQLLIGHGGLLDRIDSHLTAITVTYWIIKIFQINLF